MCIQVGHEGDALIQESQWPPARIPNNIHIEFSVHLHCGGYFSFQSFGSKRETEIQSVEKLPENLTDERAGSSRKSKIQSESCGGATTKAHVPKSSDGKELGTWLPDSPVIYQ
jgi:hypothetical protein